MLYVSAFFKKRSVKLVRRFDILSFEFSMKRARNTNPHAGPVDLSDAEGGSRNRSDGLTFGITGALRCAILSTSLGRYTCSRLIHTPCKPRSQCSQRLTSILAGISRETFASCIERLFSLIFADELTEERPCDFRMDGTL